MTQSRFFSLARCVVLALSLIGIIRPAVGCKRIVYHSDIGRVMTARSMDWKEDMLSNL